MHVHHLLLLQQEVVAEDLLEKLLEDQVAEEFQFIAKQVLQVIHLLHHHLKVILEEMEKMLEVHQITEAAVAEATVVLEVMAITEMMEHQDQEQRILLQDHL